jgi:hypothetical protein
MDQKIKLWALALLGFLAVACTQEPSPPGPVSLLAPAVDESCASGPLLPDGTRSVSFSWTPSDHTDAYSVSVVQIDNAQIRSEVVSQTTVVFNLPTYKAYSWQVIASNKEVTETSLSERRYFFVAGALTAGIPQTPAALQPSSGSRFPRPSSGQVLLSWQSADADGDLFRYTLYVDTQPVPLQEVALTSPLANTYQLAVVPQTTYYWQIKVEDAQGNTALSPVFDFKILD